MKHHTNHAMPKTFKCKGYNCSMVFTRSEHLTRHIRKHTGERPYKCENCLKLFSRLDNLRQHIQTVHSASGGAVRGARAGSRGEGVPGAHASESTGSTSSSSSSNSDETPPLVTTTISINNRPALKPKCRHRPPPLVLGANPGSAPVPAGPQGTLSIDINGINTPITPTTIITKNLQSVEIKESHDGDSGDAVTAVNSMTPNATPSKLDKPSQHSQCAANDKLKIKNLII